MAPLLTYDPTGASFHPVSKAQYDALLASIKSHPEATNVTSNSCSVSGVDFAWQYFDTPAEVHVQIVKRHGFIVSHVPTETIFDRLRDEFFNQL